MLNNFNIEYEIEKEFNVNNKNYFVDFYLPKNNLIIEVQGDYWHANPKYFLENDNIRGTLVKDIWEKDNLRKITFINQNYNYISFWEEQIRINTKYIIEFLKLLNYEKN